MRHVLAGLAAASLVTASTAGPINPEHVPADAKIVIHVDLEGLVESELGQFLMEHGDHLDDLKEIEHELGIDPFEEIRDITVCLLGDDEEDAVILATVSDALEGVIDRIEEYADELRHDVRRRWGGDVHTLHMDGKEVQALVIEARRGYRVALSPGGEWLRMVAETIEGEERSLADTDLGHVRPGRGAFLFLAVNDISKLPFDHDDPPAQVLKRASGFTAEIGEDDGEVFARAALRLRERGDADRVIQIVQGLLALGALMDEDQVDREFRAALKLLRSIDLDVDGRMIEASFHHDLRDLVELMEALD